MSDVVTALKLSNEGSGAGGSSSPLDADQTAVDIEAGNDFVSIERLIIELNIKSCKIRRSLLQLVSFY